MTALMDGVEPVTLNLPDDFWNARPALRHIRQAAWSRLVSPDAVLGSLLARVAASSPHRLQLPALVGSAQGLSFIAVACGPSGLGKSASSAVAAELLPAPEHVLELPVGSGEGIAEAFFGDVDDKDDRGRQRKVKKQIHHAAIFHVDEGQLLTDIGKRSGSTLLPTIRSAFTSGLLGQANARAENKRIVPAGSYVVGMVVGIQPEKAQPLLDDAAGGTPQRFYWTWANDPGLDPGSEWPGRLSRRQPCDGSSIDVCSSVAQEVRAEHLAKVRGERQVDAIDQHRTLVRLKTAALLSILDGRLDVAEDDWRLAGMALEVSTRVRRHVEALLARENAQRETASHARSARRRLTEEGSLEQRALKSGARAIARRVQRDHAAGSHTDQGEGCSRRCLAQAPASKHRSLASVDEMIAEAEDVGWIAPTGERWLPGESQPA